MSDAHLPSDLLDGIRAQNLGAYASMPSRVDEDVAQEAQIAQDYRGRLTFELLQNADDAMKDGGFAERIRFRLTDEALEVSNSGRSLTTEDVSGLCGTGASSKTAAAGRRRASIGHKGMGFKSVLEITDRPEVISDTIGFRLDADDSLPEINEALTRVRADSRRRVPIMRLPWPLNADPPGWAEAREAGMRVLFRFPLKPTLSREQRTKMASRLLELPVTAILFLKHLDDVEVEVATAGVSGRFRWRLSRERREDGVWTPVPGFELSGMYRVRVLGDDGTDRTFLVAHDADVDIGAYRGGLDGVAWEEIELTEVSVAVPWPVDSSMPGEWSRFHVFLPTQDRSPYPMIVNGAFRTDLSRQEIRIGEDRLDYNRHLLAATARVFGRLMLPTLRALGVRVEDRLALLDRHRANGSRDVGSAAATLHTAFCAELAAVPFIPGEGELDLAISELVVPPPAQDPSIGRAFREVLPADATSGDRWFPTAPMCDGRVAATLTDLGARCLSISEAADVLAGADPDRSRLRPHPVAGEALDVDPVLDVLGRIWADCRGRERTELEHGVRQRPLFPVGVSPDGFVRRVVSDQLDCYYPPRGLSGELPLRGLEFMLQTVCWGELTKKDRPQRLHDELAAWQGLFGIQDFKFADVMHSSVFPALDLELSRDGAALRVVLQSVDRIAAICQLAGRTAKATSPLPYERLGSNRALFNLARLRLPCRPRPDGIEHWEPAYRVYFGEDWIGEASVERVVGALDPAVRASLGIQFLAPFSEFKDTLGKYRHLPRASADDDDLMEVSEEEDEDAEIESDEKERWSNFLTWLGVNRVLRPVSFHDVQESVGGWLSTAGLTKPKGQAFAGLGEIWDEYAGEVRGSMGHDGGDATRYFYGLHDLDHIAALLTAANGDGTGLVARALFAHLAHGWPQLSGFTKLAVAVSSDRGISKRPTPKPNDDELRFPADNFWVHRLRQAGWVPSSHGPRPPARVWRPSAEIDRRFGRRGANAGDLIPLLEIDAGVPIGRADTLAQLLGIRADLSPTTFSEADARALLERIERQYAALAADGLDERMLRDVIRPAYRNLLELMGGSAADEDEAEAGPVAASLGDCRVLVHDGHGSYGFVPAIETFYVSRSGTRERLGQPRLQAFILETSVTARRALQQLGIRTLEAALQWVARPGNPSLDEDGLEAFSSGLAELFPFVLARLRADRSDDRSASRDATRLRALLGAIQPVDSLALECRLGGQSLLESDARDSHVSDDGKGGLVAYVRWGERGWPPSSREANALATVLVDALGAGAFEAYLALVSADGPSARYQLLRYAGAPASTASLQEFHDALFGPEPIERPGGDPRVDVSARTTTNEGEAWLGGAAATPPPDTGHQRRVPLYSPDQLLIAGVPVAKVGTMPGDDALAEDVRHIQGSPGTSVGRRGGATDLDELNAVGMWVALNFERHRLQVAGHPGARIFVPGESADGALVFDVSAPEAIQRAEAASAAFAASLERLVRRDVSRDWPGFDILTLAPDGNEDDERLIELKSSGIDAQSQSMTWNEWKTARESTLRQRFYLYLVSNLRSDLGNRAPYLRAVRDPFGTLWQQTILESTTVERSVQLNLRQFTLAEELELQVLVSRAPSSTG